MRIALVIHPTRREAADIATVVVSAAQDRDIEVTVAPLDHERVPSADMREVGDTVAADLILAVGGDGTVLEAARLGVQADVPVLGVNVGHIGFLAEVEPDRIEAALDAVVGGRFEESRRMTLATTAPNGQTAIGLNDAVLEKSVSQHVVDIDVSVGDEHLVQYRADAVVVATPTGSTAYTFSAGGPLVDPELEALVVTAVAPHTLFGRPIVLRPSVELTLAVQGDRPARLNVDGREVSEVEPGEQVKVARNGSPARFVKFSPRNFTATVRDKFHLDDA